MADAAQRAHDGIGFFETLLRLQKAIVALPGDAQQRAAVGLAQARLRALLGSADERRDALREWEQGTLEELLDAEGSPR